MSHAAHGAAAQWEPSVGETVLVNGKHVGVVRYLGSTQFAEGFWVGLEMRKPIGKHEGTVLGVSYFTCATPEPKHGTFVRLESVGPFDEGSAAAVAIQAGMRGASARRRAGDGVLAAAHAALDADAELQQLKRQGRLAAGAGGDLTHRTTPSAEELDKWEREAAAAAVAAAAGGGGGGGHLSIAVPPSEAQVWELMAAFSDGQLPPFHTAFALACAFRRWAAALPTLLELTVEEGTRLTVVGDTHGQLEDVFTIFTINGVPSPANRYLFNGDFVDRGPRGVETLCTLFAWALQAPPGAGARGAPCLLHRGNHEVHSQNYTNGFFSEVQDKYGGGARGGGAEAGLRLYDAFQAAFEALPLASVISGAGAGAAAALGKGAGAGAGAGAAPRAPAALDALLNAAPLPPPPAPAAGGGGGGGKGRPPRVFVVHGGLFHRREVTLAQIAAVNRFRPIPLQLGAAGGAASLQDQLFEEMMWSDPRAGVSGSEKSDRGAGVFFGPAITLDFCATNGLSLVVRSHECKDEGIEWLHEGRLATLFSASRYCGVGDNKGAVLTFDDALRHRALAFVAGRLPDAAPARAPPPGGVPPPLPPPPRHNPLDAAVHRLLVERIVLRKADLYWCFAAEDRARCAGAGSEARAGYLPRLAWASCMRLTLNLDLPWLALAPKLAAIEPDGCVHWPSFLSRYAIAMQAANLKWMTAITEKLAAALFSAFPTVEASFAAVDENASGSIDVVELSRALAKHNLGLGREQLCELMAFMDADGNGRVCLAEWRNRFKFTFSKLRDDQRGGKGGGGGGGGGAPPAAKEDPWVRATLQALGAALFKPAAPGEEPPGAAPAAAFAALDTDGDGLLSFAEFSTGVAAHGLKLTAAEVKKLMEAIDANKSQSINISEVRGRGGRGRRAGLGPPPHAPPPFFFTRVPHPPTPHTPAHTPHARSSWRPSRCSTRPRGPWRSRSPCGARRRATTTTRTRPSRRTGRRRGTPPGSTRSSAAS
jgi:Ca2+-binding EF-hand superfamily protein/diadenosine tetraphosphatase ApaH/serine/threonine PP2A family protein phosphatase